MEPTHVDRRRNRSTPPTLPTISFPLRADEARDKENENGVELCCKMKSVMTKSAISITCSLFAPIGSVVLPAVSYNRKQACWSRRLSL
ncbi:hypothetical protein DAT39_005099, partial [Clarias magur]